MSPRNILNLRLSKPIYETDTQPLSAGQLEAATNANVSAKHPPRPRNPKARSYNLTRIPKLLMLGYASEESQRRYEMQRDWKRMYTILMFKIENISIVSGLLLASSCNLLIVGDDLRRMTHAAVTASMFGSILSIVFGLLCRINITPGRLEFLVTRTRLFYYLYATPSLWGGAAALVFFVAVCAFTWLEESTAQYGWEAKSAAVVLSVALIGNACACFVLGAGVVAMQVEAAEKEEEEREEREKEGGEQEERIDEINELDERNERRRIQPEAQSSEFSSGFFGLGLTSDFGERSPSPPKRVATFGSNADAPSRRAYRRQTQW